MKRLSIMAFMCYSLYLSLCYGFEDTVSKQEKRRLPLPVEIDGSDQTKRSDQEGHMAGKEKTERMPVKSTDGSEKKERQHGGFVPSEKIPADQAVDFPADI